LRKQKYGRRLADRSAGREIKARRNRIFSAGKSKGIAGDTESGRALRLVWWEGNFVYHSNIFVFDT
jgi:hypothetical protein